MPEKVAVITGSSRGIGQATALAYAQAGYRVVINYHGSREQAEKVLEKIKSDGGNAIALAADISKPEECNQLIQETIKEYGGIDVLVNNAGINHDQLMIRIQDEEWQKVINTNLSSVFYCSRAAVKYMMRKRWGRIINISSVVGISGNAGQTHYAASKSGILGLTCSIAKEYGNRGITANAIAPGFIESDMTRILSPEQKKQILSTVAVGRLGTPEDVAALALFLASEQASYINGQVIRVDGGMGF
ncbi:MAG: 3-oxoacyl-[acyl-carrier-protein] reductase [Syntrophomonadaceae bacterium]